MARKLKIGDRVILNSDAHQPKKGLKGKIMYIKSNGSTCGVEFDVQFRGGHDCEGNCHRDRGQWVSMCHLDLDVPKVKLSKKEKETKIKVILKEIKANKEFIKCFKSEKELEKEVRSWEDYKIKQW